MNAELWCMRCGETGSVRQPLDWCRCGFVWSWELLDRGCPDNPKPERHGYVRRLNGLFDPIAKRSARD